MRVTVRAADITKRKTGTGVAVTRFGALALGLGLTMLAGAFFSGPALAQQGAAVPSGVVMDHEDGHDDEPPPCGDNPLPPCDNEPTTPPPDPDPTDTDEPPVDPPPTPKPPKPPKPTPTGVKTTIKPPPDNGGGNGGNGGGGQDNSGGGGGSVDNDGPQLPATGAEASLLAGLGAALVGGGAALVVLARRRRAALATATESSEAAS